MSATIENTKALLEKVAEMRKASLENAKKTGASFNIFSILGLEHYETSTHSAFLRELLDPNGTHAQGDAFLQLFLRHIGCQANFHTTTAVVSKEFHLGAINADYTEGGFIDILIADGKGNVIGIENKIYAGDQEKQLERYAAYLKRNSQSSNRLIYLTLDGKKASEVSVGNGAVAYQPISYKNEILDWLRSCQEAVSEIPSLKEAIGQYMELIKKLTQQSMDAASQKQLVNWIIEKDFVKDVEDASGLWDAVKKKLLFGFKDSFIERFDGQYRAKGFTIEADENFGGNDQGFIIKKDNWKCPIHIGFESNSAEIYVGIKASEFTGQHDSESRMRHLFESFRWGKVKGNQSWIVWSYIDKWKGVSWGKVPTDGVVLILDTFNEFVSRNETLELLKN